MVGPALPVLETKALPLLHKHQQWLTGDEPKTRDQIWVGTRLENICAQEHAGVVSAWIDLTIA